MKKNNFKNRLLKRWMLCCLMGIGFVQLSAQELYVGDGATFFVAQGTAFTTSNNLVSHHANGNFAVEAGFDWTAAGATEYVDGSMAVIGAGTTTLHVGNSGSYSPITVTTANADDHFVGSYTKAEPATAAMHAALSNYELSDSEFWSVAKTAGTSVGVTVSGLTADANATYDGNASSGTDKVVHLNTTWNEYAATSEVGDFSYASEMTALAIDKIDAATFSLYPNPANVYGTVQFQMPENTEVMIAVYNITGSLVHQQVGGKSFSLTTSGIYLVKFVANGKVTIKQLVIK